MIQDLVSKTIELLIKVISYVPVYIYNLFYSRFYTRWTYYMVADRLSQKKQLKSLLDVGIGTGHPMRQIMHRIPRECQVLGIDIDKNYLKYATKTFKMFPNVEIREQNFYLLENSKEKFDIIIFSSSFMIMPDRIKALEIAKSCLNPNGSIFFLLTLENDKQNLRYAPSPTIPRTTILEKVKPFLKMVTTIEFGTITYERAFEKMLNENNLNIVFKEQVAIKSIFLYIFRMFVVEAQIQT